MAPQTQDNLGSLSEAEQYQLLINALRRGREAEFQSAEDLEILASKLRVGHLTSNEWNAIALALEEAANEMKAARIKEEQHLERILGSLWVAKKDRRDVFITVAGILATVIGVIALVPGILKNFVETAESRQIVVIVGLCVAVLLFLLRELFPREEKEGD